MSAQRVAYLRQYIMDSIPDKEKVLFREYNDLIIKMVEDLEGLNEKQNKILTELANRSEN